MELHCLFTFRTLSLLQAAFSLICCNVSVAMSDHTVDFDVKLRAIRGQILSKLGMNHPPDVSPNILANIEIPSDVQQLYDVLVEMSRRKESKRLQQVQAEASRYFAHRVFTVEAKELQGKFLNLVTCIEG